MKKNTLPTISALEQALADISTSTEPRREDEFTSREMHEKLKAIMSLASVQRKLRDLADSGKYTRRPMGRDFLYRKS